MLVMAPTTVPTIRRSHDWLTHASMILCSILRTTGPELGSASVTSTRSAGGPQEALSPITVTLVGIAASPAKTMNPAINVNSPPTFMADTLVTPRLRWGLTTSAVHGRRRRRADQATRARHPTVGWRYPRPVTHTIGLLGDDRGHRSHQELNALVPQLREQYGVSAVWVPTDSDFDLADYDGIWLVPGSPYADDDAVIETLRAVRKSGMPFLGACGGMQYAVMEFLRTELGRKATHAESDGESDDNAVVPLACSLYGKEGRVTPVPGSRFAEWVPVPFQGMHFCNYAPSAESVALLERAGVVVGATGEESVTEVLEFANHPFYVVSMFQPHIGALAGAPIHPLVAAFVRAVMATGARHRVPHGSDSAAAAPR